MRMIVVESIVPPILAIHFGVYRGNVNASWSHHVDVNIIRIVRLWRDKKQYRPDTGWVNSLPSDTRKKSCCGAELGVCA